jgi:hypothetical protein
VQRAGKRRVKQYRVFLASDCGASATAEYDREGGKIAGSPWVFMRSEEEDRIIVMSLFERK